MTGEQPTYHGHPVESGAVLHTPLRIWVDIGLMIAGFVVGGVGIIVVSAVVIAIGVVLIAVGGFLALAHGVMQNVH